MFAHIQRHRNELVYVKCLSENCDYSTIHRPKATGVFAFLQECNMNVIFSTTHHTTDFGKNSLETPPYKTDPDEINDLSGVEKQFQLGHAFAQCKQVSLQ